MDKIKLSVILDRFVNVKFDVTQTQDNPSPPGKNRFQLNLVKNRFTDLIRENLKCFVEKSPRDIEPVVVKTVAWKGTCLTVTCEKELI